ncbi:IS3 family transposase [Streptomyces bacillaris]|uniref:IS3 family transposase n=1 Tax=Streptomyces bacillaris TaxID=68179 RepID=UPI00365324CD
MPKPYPREFRDDVVRVARNREPGTTLAQVAKDFGINASTLNSWLRESERHERPRAAAAASAPEDADLREARRRIRQLEQENEVLRRAAAYFSQAHLPKMIYPLVRELAAENIPVAVTCRVLGIARQPYYRWLDKPVTDAEYTEAYRTHALFTAHEEDPEFGYRLLADEAKAAGEAMAERTAWRLCSRAGWFSRFGKAKAVRRRPGPAVHDDLVRRKFTAAGLNELWLTDITEHGTVEGKLYLCAIKDVASGRIVGYAIDHRMKSRLAVNAINNAVAMRKAAGQKIAGCVVHSDRGSQFRAKKTQKALRRHELIGSMGRVASSADNAAMESFFSLLQKNVLNRRSWTTREELRTAIVTWIERTYHRRRRQRSRSMLTPVEYEIVNPTQLTQAA